jgi:hypothetical protein
VSAPCRANCTDAAEAEPSRDRGKPVSEPCRANCTDAAAAEPSRDQENPVSEPCRAPLTSIRVNELYCVTLPPLSLLYLG